MKDLLALRSVGAIAAVFAASMLILWALAGQSVARYLIPSPDTAAEQFLSALKAHRYQVARDQLSQDLRQQVREADLQELVRAIEAAHQGLEGAHGHVAREDGDSATAALAVELGDRREQTLEFALRKEHGVWKVGSIDPLRQLADPNK